VKVRPLSPQRVWRKTTGPGEVKGALDEEQHLVVGRGGEGEERGVAEALESEFAVDVREEIDGEAAADAFFVAPEEDFLERGKLVGFDGEVDLVDDVLRHQGAEIVEGEHRVLAGQSDRVGGL